MNQQQFSPKEIANYRKYLRVQMGGRWNMFDPMARMATGLTEDEYIFVMKNYAALEKAAESEAKE